MIGFINFPKWLKPEIIPGLPIRWYGLMYIVAFTIAFLLFKYQLKEKKINASDELVTNYFFWGIVGVLVGGRILAATLYDQTGRYLMNPLLIFWPFDGCRFTGLAGMSYHGALIGGTIAIIIYSKVKKIDFLEWGDMLMASVPLGYTFGRIGNFINAELYGRITTVPWGMVFPVPESDKFSVFEPWVSDFAAKAGIRISDTAQLINLPRHPSQLYEAFFEGIVLWLVLWFVIRKFKTFKGFVISSYFIGYGTVRFFIEYFRQPDAGMDFPLQFSQIDNPNYLLATAWNFTTGQILCFIMIAAGFLSMYGFYRYDKMQKEKAGSEKSGAKILTNRKMRKKIKAK